MLMAGLDGIERELDPGEPIDRNLYELPPEQLADIPTVPTTLDEALDALEADHAFLTRGGVFTDDLIATYIEFRREQSDRVKIRPHPYEFPHVLRRLAQASSRCAPRRCVRPSSRTSIGERRFSASSCSRSARMSSAVPDALLAAEAARRAPAARARALIRGRRRRGVTRDPSSMPPARPAAAALAATTGAGTLRAAEAIAPPASLALTATPSPTLVPPGRVLVAAIAA